MKTQRCFRNGRLTLLVGCVLAGSGQALASCLTSSSTWQNTAIAGQADVFVAEFDATPSAGNIDGVTGLSAGAGTDYSSFAVVVRFTPFGTIDARDGDYYRAVATIPYTAGTSYHFRVFVSLPLRRYSVSVMPAGGQEQYVAVDYGFRTEQLAVTCLDNWGLQAASGSHEVCNFTLSPGDCRTSSGSWQNTPFSNQAASFSVEFQVTPNAAGLDAITALSNGPASGYNSCAAQIRLSTANRIDVRDAAVYRADTVVAYSPGTAYHFRVLVDVPAHRYTVYVTVGGGSEQLLASNYAFRTEQASVSSLNTWALQSGTGTHQVCNLVLCRVRNETRSTWHSTIQSAIDAAVNGDDIALNPGTYTGPGNRDIDYGGKAITVRSTNPDDSVVVEATVIDCQGSRSEPHRGFIFQTNETASSVLDGVTITRGWVEYLVDYVEDHGGGIKVIYASPVIRKCRLVSNRCSLGMGGGISAGSSTVEGCVIRNNYGRYCGGVVSYLGSIRDCLIESNYAYTDGGGVWVHGGLVDRCRILRNTCGSDGAGLTGGHGAIVSNSVIAGNACTDSEGIGGGGVSGFTYSDTSVLRGCTIVGNSAGAYGYGGGVVRWGGAIVNCIVYANYSSHFGAADLYQCSLPLYSCGGIAEGPGNILGDPLFVDMDGPDGDITTWGDNDLHLLATSPAVNAAHPGFDYAGQTDVEGAPRVQSCTADIGAYESSYERYARADFDHNCHVDPNDFALFAACATRTAVPYDPLHLPSACTLTPVSGRIGADFDSDGDVDMQDFGVFQRCYSGVSLMIDPACEQ